jgi:hypothetical protein
MKIYCSHIWQDKEKSIGLSQFNKEEKGYGSISIEFVPIRVCDLCHVEWLKGDRMPEVEIGHTKE